MVDDIEYNIGEEEIGHTSHSRKHDNNLESSVFRFRNISFVVGSGKKRKQILSNISGTVRWGHVLAVMGPSGAGKTTLINALTLDGLYGRTYGSVTLNGIPLTDQIFKRYCCVVPQQDKHWPYLTTFETLMYAAELYDIAETKEDMVAIVEEVLKKTGMETTRKTKAGSLSGGQRRRLSIGIALLKQPALLFLDEPTSGLDAAAASHVMQEIRRIAKAEKLIIVCTIHQPSTKVYNGFDQIMILSKGREAFTGDVSDAEPYFAKIGHPLPPAMNPAEHFLDLVNADFSADEEVDRILDTWQQQKPKDDDEDIGEIEIPASGNSGGGFAKEISIMFRRHSLLIIRDPVLYVGRMAIFLVSNLFFGFVYFNARAMSQEQVLNKIWICIWYIGVPCNMGVVAVYALNDEFKSIVRETKNGMLSATSYVLAKTILVLPIMYIFAVVALGLSGFVIQSWQGASFGDVTVLWAVEIFVFECVAEALSVLTDDPILGMLNFMNYWFAAFLFGGFLIPANDIYWPLKAFYYCMPYAYFVRSLIFSLFSTNPWEPCTDPTIGAVCSPSGDGQDILEQVGNRVFPLVEPEDTFAVDVGIMLCIGVVFKIIYILTVVMKANQASKVAPAI